MVRHDTPVISLVFIISPLLEHAGKVDNNSVARQSPFKPPDCWPTSGPATGMLNSKSRGNIYSNSSTTSK